MPRELDFKQKVMRKCVVTEIQGDTDSDFLKFIT